MRARSPFALLVAFLAVALGGCTHSLHVSHFSDFSPTYAAYQKGHWVSSEEEQFVIMGFVTDTRYVDRAFQNLAGQCPNGEIQGVQTQYSTAHGFFSWTNRIHLQGLCLKKG